MNYLRPSTDFFGSNADGLLCPITLETPVKPLISDCGERLVRGINALAQGIVSSKKWPQWQRWNGSIIYERLPEELQKVLKKTDFDRQGYIILSKTHICTQEAIFGMSKAQRGKHQKNYCQLPGCWDPEKQIKILTSCASLAYRLAEGRTF